MDPLRSQEFYPEPAIDLKLGVRVAAIEPDAHALVMEDGQRLSYGALLLATGAEPIRLEVPGAALPHVHVLRTLADCDALIARVATVRHCVVIGASFIGLKVAASLRIRGLQVDVVAPELAPWSGSWALLSATWCARYTNRTGNLPSRRDRYRDRR